MCPRWTVVGSQDPKTYCGLEGEDVSIGCSYTSSFCVPCKSMPWALRDLQGSPADASEEAGGCAGISSCTRHVGQGSVRDAHRGRKAEAPVHELGKEAQRPHHSHGPLRPCINGTNIYIRRRLLMWRIELKCITTATRLSDSFDRSNGFEWPLSVR
jgi:hypothetical protein